METHMQEEKKKKNSGIHESKNPKQEASPSSTSSSPSHEFSFTISLQPLSSSSSSSSPYSKPNPNLRTTTTTKTTSSSSSHQTDPFAVDLSPADEIFFHGHLLPLHLLSHLPVSPRTSTASLDSFALPVKDILHDKPTPRHDTTPNNDDNNKSSDTKSTSSSSNIVDKTCVSNGENRGKSKPIRSFSLFNLWRWRKGLEAKDREEEEQEEHEDKTKQQQRKKKLVSLDLSHALKKYIRMLFPRRGNGTQFMRRRQAYSFSSATTATMNARSRNNHSSNNGYSISKDLRGRIRRRGEFSAPASMRTSPTNSGHLRGISTTTTSSSTSSDSTMEELQAAIQAAIAHCKNSIAAAPDGDNKEVSV